MSLYENDFQARMAAGKANAAKRRDRDGGGGTVTMYGTTSELLTSQGKPQFDNFDVWLATVRDRVIEITEASRFAIYGHQWEGFE